MAIIEDPGYGLRDNNYPCLWFTVKTINGKSLQVLAGDDADEVIKDSGVYHVKDLAGKACVVNRGQSTLQFLRMHK